jgi:hypothetical protein
MIIEYDCEVCGTHVRKHQVKGMEHRFCSRSCRYDWQRTQKPVDREWLYQKYIVEGLDCTQISKIVGRHSKRVWEWLKDYDIPTRPRGGVANGSKAKPVYGKKHSPETREKIRQARLRDGRVPYLKNGKHHLKDKKGAETPNWKGGVTPERQAVYGSDEWRQAARVVWKRDNFTCQRCCLTYRDARKRSIRFNIHHIVSFAVRELRCEVSNLVLLCRPCHLWVHSSANIHKEFINVHNGD